MSVPFNIPILEQYTMLWPDLHYFCWSCLDVCRYLWLHSIVLNKDLIWSIKTTEWLVLFSCSAAADLSNCLDTSFLSSNMSQEFYRHWIESRYPVSMMWRVCKRSMLLVIFLDMAMMHNPRTVSPIGWCSRFIYVDVVLFYFCTRISTLWLQWLLSNKHLTFLCWMLVVIFVKVAVSVSQFPVFVILSRHWRNFPQLRNRTINRGWVTWNILLY